jgi:hypothetical protein
VVVGFVQADGMLLEGIGDEEQFVSEPEGAGVGDEFHQEVTRILERGQLVGEGPWETGWSRAPVLDL